MLDYIQLDYDSKEPKYLQIIDSIISNISKGNFQIGDKIPSIVKLSQEFYISRDTVERAYSVLKKRNVIVSVHGKGTYIADNKIELKPKIVFFTNKLSPYTMKVYEAFIDKLGQSAEVDLHSYHSDESLFLELMEKFESSYDYFVIAPHFRTKNLSHTSTTERVTKVINKISKDKLILLDNCDHNIQGGFNEVYQDFRKDIFSALEQAKDSLAKYTKLTIVYPRTSFYPYPKSILDGLQNYCVQNNFKFEIIEEVTQNTEVAKENLFVTLEDNDLVKVVNKIRNSEYDLGKDIGVISYNDSPLKQLLGITVITTNFETMGDQAAKIILENKKEKRKIPINIIKRESV